MKVIDANKDNGQWVVAVELQNGDVMPMSVTEILDTGIPVSGSAFRSRLAAGPPYDEILVLGDRHPTCELDQLLMSWPAMGRGYLPVAWLVKALERRV